ncbi:PhzF family phenazine biosynthesis protein [filamentous cyanobacterium CCP2]|nr:PhzF family phenazine biosynthesis protein [filamentous cyanobacterium CCP2]
MGLTIFQVDAFTSTPFAGNPAAVCVLDTLPEDGWMQKLAREMNLSETAFLVRQEDGFNLRWFTPKVEVNLCGHATLASAHILWTEGHLAPDQEARFHTRSGLLTAKQEDGWIIMNFPVDNARDIKIRPELIKALNAPICEVYEGTVGYIVEVNSEEVVRAVQPNVEILKTLPAKGLVVTSPANGTEYDFVSRFFAPALGIIEDPVTGAAHCALGPFWRDRLNKSEFLAYQASARGGVLKVRCEGDRVVLGGQAITVMKAELLTP